MVFDFIQANPAEAGQIALSLALVVVTAVYTYFTYTQTTEMKKTREVSNQQTIEMEKTRERSNQPVLQGSLLTHVPTLVVAEFKNTGNTAAHNLSATIDFDDLNADPLQYTIPILSPDEDYRFRLPLDNSDKALWKMDEVESILNDQDSSGILTFEFCFENPFGKEYCNKNSINVFEWLDNSSYSVRYSEEAQVIKALEGIESNLEDLEDLDGIESNLEDLKALEGIELDLEDPE